IGPRSTPGRYNRPECAEDLRHKPRRLDPTQIPSCAGKADQATAGPAYKLQGNGHARESRLRKKPLTATATPYPDGTQSRGCKHPRHSAAHIASQMELVCAARMASAAHVPLSLRRAQTVPDQAWNSTDLRQRSG